MIVESQDHSSQISRKLIHFRADDINFRYASLPGHNVATATTPFCSVNILKVIEKDSYSKIFYITVGLQNGEA